MAKQRGTPARPTKGDSPAAGETPPLGEVRELIELMSRHELEEIEIEHGGMKIRLKRQSPAGAAYPTYALPPQAQLPPLSPEHRHLGPTVKPEVKDVTPAGETEKLLEIRSPMVGTFYAAPSSDAPPFVAVGAEVDPETVVCIIEAMKVMNEINSGVSGTIARMLVQNGQAVDYNQPLFAVKPH